MAQTFRVNMKRFNGVDWDSIIPNLKPNYVYLGYRTSLGTQTITNASKYKMFYIEFAVGVPSLNDLAFTRGFFTPNTGHSVGVNFFDHSNNANVFLNASINGSILSVDDQGEMPFSMISGTKSFQVSVYGVEWV